MARLRLAKFVVEISALIGLFLSAFNMQINTKMRQIETQKQAPSSVVIGEHSYNVVYLPQNEKISRGMDELLDLKQENFISEQNLQHAKELFDFITSHSNTPTPSEEKSVKVGLSVLNVLKNIGTTISQYYQRTGPAFGSISWVTGKPKILPAAKKPNPNSALGQKRPQILIYQRGSVIQQSRLNNTGDVVNWNGTPMFGNGIYILIFQEPGGTFGLYIGRSGGRFVDQSMAGRCERHQVHLVNGRHRNRPLQTFFNSCGNVMQIRVLDGGEKYKDFDTLQKAEKAYIQAFDTLTKNGVIKDTILLNQDMVSEPVTNEQVLNILNNRGVKPMTHVQDLDFYKNSPNLFQPGVLKVVCIQTGRALIWEGESIISEMNKFQRSVVDGIVDNPLLLEDYQTYGFDSFNVFITTGPGLESKEQREAMLTSMKNAWQGELY